MTRTDEPLVIRPPGWVRVLGPILLAAWVSVFLVEERPDGFLVPGLLIAAFAVAVVGRMFFSSVIGASDGRLTVRNVWSTRTFTRGEIEGVDVDRVRGRGWALSLRLADGSRHRLDVTEAPFLGPFATTLERQAAEVRAWLEGRPHAYL